MSRMAPGSEVSVKRTVTRLPPRVVFDPLRTELALAENSVYSLVIEKCSLSMPLIRFLARKKITSMHF